MITQIPTQSQLCCTLCRETKSGVSGGLLDDMGTVGPAGRFSGSIVKRKAAATVPWQRHWRQSQQSGSRHLLEEELRDFYHQVFVCLGFGVLRANEALKMVHGFPA